jgi:RNA methyltransferase, TrmH family
MTIKPASNNQVKAWKKLAMGKYRKREGLFIAEGERCVEQILENGAVTVECILIRDNLQVPAGLSSTNLPVYSLTDNDFRSVTDTENPQGIAAVCEIPGESEFQDLASLSGLLVAFDAVQDPGNLGTMIRTASWFGVSGLIFGEGTVDPFHPKVVRSTAGATGVLPFRKMDLTKELAILEASGFSTFLLDGSDQSVAMKTITPEPKSILVIGNEANGIQDKLFTQTRTRIRIDGNAGHVESLNAAVALSIGLWHFRERIR